MKIGFGFKNIINIVLALMLLYFEFFMIYITLFESPELTVMYDYIILLLLIIGAIVFTVKFFISNLIPKYFKAMRAVRKYIGVDDLNKLVVSECFSSIDLPDHVRKLFYKSAYRNLKKEFLISENWVLVNGVLIPKKMIIKLGSRAVTYRSYSASSEVLYIDTVNKRFEFGPMFYEDKCINNYLNKLLNLKHLKGVDKNKYINRFNEIENKEQFLDFIV